MSIRAKFISILKEKNSPIKENCSNVNFDLNVDARSLKRQIQDVDNLIIKFEQIIREYPYAEAYKEMLAKLQQTRVNIVDKIGRN